MTKFGELLPLNHNDLELILNWRNSPLVRANMYTQHVINIKEHSEWWERTKSRCDQQYFIYKFQSVASGVVSFTNIDAGNMNASWAFYSSSEAQKGTGTRMEFLALEYAFNKLNLHKLNCEVLSFNLAVLKLHGKFGFKEEGILRSKYLINDKFTDVHCLGLLKSEWCACKGDMIERINAITKERK